MPNLVVDIGNTQAKLAVFEDQALIWYGHYDQPEESVINEIIQKYNVSQAIISSVRQNNNWQQLICAKIPAQLFNRQMATGINNHYRTPETLGLDRLAAVVGARDEYPGQGNLVIDAGTCITYDWVDAGGNYYGGSISPGLSMRFKAMNHYTAKLPLVDADQNFKEPAGDDTVSAIRSGVQNGLKYEAEGFIKNYQQEHNNINIILTGGDAFFLDTVLKNSIFAPYIKIDPYLVLRGLNAVTKHND